MGHRSVNQEDTVLKMYRVSKLSFYTTAAPLITVKASDNDNVLGLCEIYHVSNVQTGFERVISVFSLVKSLYVSICSHVNAHRHRNVYIEHI